MPISLIPSFLFYSIVSGITPGPANLCSLSAAMKFGKREALKQWKGLFVGYAVVSISSAFIAYFLGDLFKDSIRILSYVGATYIIYLAIHILCSNNKRQGKSTISKCNFWTGFLVQATNVKVMIFCLTALTSYILPYSSSFWFLLLIGALLPFIGPVTNLAWIFAGVRMQTVFQKHEKGMNLIMAGALLLCAVSLICT
ncbi:MAG: hypothetical protein Q4B70_17200 [Lachnospiraceae bacterium]|nr:hypothetical protein [Lachnospiraceae bacterium]